ncbi:protein phosphatase 1, regulatory subunit 3Da isoform X2 [Clupea harengus]|uniref:Protein phosphatase 1, regulatory subunit 3Da isoform X2 n=1 Tax=Clupea harengus TaxID=7950 RepID=A0A8M1KML9_CLUHA|nr:protein phosphatase 1, regulatory subunit 3Da isoform X2 [Clupea harengus]
MHFEIMAYSVEWWQKTSGRTTAPHRGSGSVPNEYVTVGLRDEAEERKKVKIRPPSPRAPRASPVLRRSLSCEPIPKPIIRRREQSLPSPPRRRRLSQRAGVRFVDSRGMKLEDVKVFKASEGPLVPDHVLFRILMNAELSGGSNLEISLPLMKPVFTQQPGDHPGFMRRVICQRVCLERVLCLEVGIVGIVQVLDLAFEKEVSVRYSFTAWKSCTETRAFWVSHKHLDDTTHTLGCDTFHFHLPVPPFLLQHGALLEFAVCYKVLGTECWDNNEGQNYRLACHGYKLTVPKECEESMIHFI